ncbi:MAG: NADH-quinone oxidoreductase subunit N [Cyclobacteriaceae bacterium]
MLKTQLEQILDQLIFLRFELILISGALLLLIIGLFSKSNVAHRIAFCLALVAALFFGTYFTEEEIVLTGSLSFGPLESFIKTLLCIFSIWIVFYSNAKKQSSEFYFLVLAVVIGSVFMISANHLLVVYISIELTSFVSYAITNFNFKKKSFEAGIKYLLFGGTSSAIMLYGISIIYGLTGELAIDRIELSGSDPFLAFGIVAFIGGLFFKVSIFPFHIWTPSTYQEAPTDSVAILSVVPKVAGFVLLHRVLSVIEAESISWVIPLIAAVGIATVLVGTLGAMGQSNIKRLMAYGSIAHSGLLIGCMLISGQSGLAAFVWYVFIYAIMNLVLFYLTSVLEEKGIETIDQLSGLGKKEAYAGVLWVGVMISLIGLPPTAGFTAKFYLFTSLWNEYQIGADYLILTFLLVAVISVIFSLFYYLKIPYYYFIHPYRGDVGIKIELFPKLFATILVMLLFWFFLSPELLNNIVSNFNAVNW